MRRIFFGLFLGFGVLLSNASFVSAQILTLNASGELVWNVLSEEIVLDESESPKVAVTKIANQETKPTKSIIELTKEGELLSMTVTADDKEKTLEITNLTDNVLEIEERPTINKLSISTKDGMFVLTQNNSQASTNLPISIDSKEATIAVRTSFGESNLLVLPQQAAFTALRAKILSSVSKSSEIIEEDGTIRYKLSGEKSFPFFSVYTYSIPVDAYVSAVTGEIVKVDSPTWYKYLSFLFV